MLIVYDKETGAVLDNHGTSSAWPEGPPDDRALLNLPGRTLADVGLLRLHDEHDAELVGKALTRQHRVDPATGQLVIGDPYPPPPPPGPTPDDELAEAIRAATSLAQLKAALLGPDGSGRVRARS